MPTQTPYIYIPCWKNNSVTNRFIAYIFFLLCIVIGWDKFNDYNVILKKLICKFLDEETIFCELVFPPLVSYTSFSKQSHLKKKICKISICLKGIGHVF